MDSAHKPKINQFECIFYLVYTISSFLLLTINHSLSSDRRHSINKDLTEHMQLQKQTVYSFLINKNLTKHLNIQIEKSNSTSLTFHPLIEPTIPTYTHPNKTWFMSTLSGAHRGLSEHFLLPSPHHPCTLCISLLNKSYPLPPSIQPGPTTHQPGLTFIADSFYDYENPRHGLNAVAPFFEWMRGEEGRCERARRLVFFKRGEVVRGWVAGWMGGRGYGSGR